jgi:hypothetical protein
MLEVAIILGAFRMGIGGLPPLFSRRVEGLIIELPAIIVQIFKIRK